MKKIWFFLALSFLITHQHCWAATCTKTAYSGNWSAMGCNTGDVVQLNGSSVTVDGNISVSSISNAVGSTLDFGNYTITLSGTTPLYNYGTLLNAGTSTVKFSDANHTVGSSFTLYNLQWETPLTAPRTLTISSALTKAAGGTFNLDGSSATNTVSFTKDLILGIGGTITPALTVYYCGGNNGVTGITCVAGPPPAPEINLKQGATNIASAGTHDFGNVAVGSNSGAITFTIENTGSANLTLSGSSKIVKGGADAADFTVDETPTTTPVAGAASTTFTVTFTPSSAAAKTATLSIANNDSDENPYTVTLNGTGTSTPTPGYSASPTSISISGATGSTPSSTLSISETGNSALNITGIAVTGTDMAKFTFSPTTGINIADGGAAQSVTVTCNGSVAGTFSATLNVTHNAAGSPATYPLSCTITASGGGGGTPPPVQASVESDLAFALTFLGIALFAAFKMRRDRKT